MNDHPVLVDSVNALIDLFAQDSNVDATALIILLRTDVTPSPEKSQTSWEKVVAKPFESPLTWIEFGISLGRFTSDKIKQEIAGLSGDKGQFSSILTVAMSARDKCIQKIAKALFHFGVHGKEMAAFDPMSLSSILEQTDELTDIAITFLAEMALINAKECVPQLFPLLSSDKASARKNSLELLARILQGDVPVSIMQMIASNILPMIGDEAISVRVDIPKLFVSVPVPFIVPSLMKLLSDSDEKKRSTASAAIDLIMLNSNDPSLLLKTILDSALGGAVASPTSPSDIQTVTSNDREKAAQRALKLVENWVSKIKGTVMLDPSPVLDRLWNELGNGVIIGFVTRCTPLFDSSRFLACLLEQLRKNDESLFGKVCPLLVLNSQLSDFFSDRDVLASPLFDLVFKLGDPERDVRQLRARVIARFPPWFFMGRLREYGLLTKPSLAVIVFAGMCHPQPIENVCDDFEAVFDTIEDDLFEPVCDAFFFADKKRCIAFAVRNFENRRGMFLLYSIIAKFETSDTVEFVRSGNLERVLKKQFGDEQAVMALDILFRFTHKCQDVILDSYWEKLFEIGSHYFDLAGAGYRINSMKLVLALLMNHTSERHLECNFARVMHMIEVGSEDYVNPGVRELATELGAMFRPLIQSLAFEL
jgi:hypothetical protein